LKSPHIAPGSEDSFLNLRYPGGKNGLIWFDLP
jgi:hypothetical protein